MSITLPTNWVDNVGMVENAAFLNNVGTQVNANTADIATNAAAISAVLTPAAASVATSRQVNSTTYTDATDATDEATVIVGSSGIVMVYIVYTWTYISGSGGSPIVGVALSGANTVAASDTYSVTGAGSSGTNVTTAWLVFDGLSAGSTTFKMKYKSGTDVIAFSNRKIAVIPFA